MPTTTTERLKTLSKNVRQNDVVSNPAGTVQSPSRHSYKFNMTLQPLSSDQSKKKHVASDIVDVPERDSKTRLSTAQQYTLQQRLMHAYFVRRHCCRARPSAFPPRTSSRRESSTLWPGKSGASAALALRSSCQWRCDSFDRFKLPTRGHADIKFLTRADRPLYASVS